MDNSNLLGVLHEIIYFPHFSYLILRFCLMNDLIDFQGERYSFPHIINLAKPSGSDAIEGHYYTTLSFFPAIHTTPPPPPLTLSSDTLH